MLDANRIQQELDRANREHPRLLTSIKEATRNLDELSRKKRASEDAVQKNKIQLEKSEQELKSVIVDSERMQKSLDEYKRTESEYKRKIEDFIRQLETITRDLRRK